MESGKKFIAMMHLTEKGTINPAVVAGVPFSNAFKPSRKQDRQTDKKRASAMTPESQVFETHYIDYLQQISSLDFDAVALKLGGDVKKNSRGRG